MNQKVSTLHVIEGAGRTNNPLLQRFEEFVGDELLDLGAEAGEDFLTLIELESSKPDEVLLGTLTDFEKRCFALAQLVEQSIKDTLLEYEASATEGMAKYMRENRVPMLEAMKHQMQHAPEDLRIDMNKRAITHTALITAYDWSVRTRLNQWSRQMIVRKDYTVYAYG